MQNSFNNCGGSMMPSLTDSFPNIENFGNRPICYYKPTVFYYEYHPDRQCFDFVEKFTNTCTGDYYFKHYTDCFAGGSINWWYVGK